MVAVAAVLLGLFAVIIGRVTDTPMATLYSDLTLEDSSRVVGVLEAANVPFELGGGGTSIRVPTDQVLRLRMDLAAEGLPSGGSIGYEIFDQTNTLGSTSFVQNINHIRALEGELARSIRTIDRVAAARVHLVIPERALFQRDIREPTASIVLQVRGALEAGQIRAIQHLAASAVDGLKPGRVSIVDEGGRLLATGDEDAVAGIAAGVLDDRAAAYERRLAASIDEIVTSVVGPDRARVQVNAELDFSRVTETRDRYDPDGQVMRSTQTRTEETATANQNGAVTVGNALPGGEAGGADGGRDTAEITEETVNYEIGRTTTTEIVEAGRLKRISVAVLVDGVYTQGADGVLAYGDRPAADLERIAALVRSAVGFDQARGDVVEVVNLRFNEAPRFDALPVEAAGSFLGLEKADLFSLAEIGVTLLIGAMVLLVVVRPLIRRIVTPDPGAGAGLIAANGMTAAIAGPSGQHGIPALLPGGGEAVLQIERAKQNGAVRAEALAQVGKLAQENPANAAAILRTWMAEPA